MCDMQKEEYMPNGIQESDTCCVWPTNAVAVRAAAVGGRHGGEGVGVGWNGNVRDRRTVQERKAGQVQVDALGQMVGAVGWQTPLDCCKWSMRRFHM